MLPTPQDLDPDFPLPLRGGPGEPLDTERRYFLNFPGVNQYVTIPEVTLTGDFKIDFDVFGGAANDRLMGTTSRISNRGSLRINPADSTALSFGVFGTPTGDREVSTPTGFLSPGLLQSITITSIGSDLTITNNNNGRVFTGQIPIDEIKFNSISRHLEFNFNGIIANVRISDNGTPVRLYPLDDNSTTIRDTIGGNDGTYINGAAADWGRFERQYGGDWQGQGLTVPPWASAEQILEIA